MAEIPRAVKWNLKIFSAREPALRWLMAIQDSLQAARSSGAGCVLGV